MPNTINVPTCFVKSANYFFEFLKMDTNVTHVDTVLVLHSIVEATLFIPWFYLLILVWIWQRFLRSKYQTWAWDEILVRIGNPALFLTTQIHPSEAGDIQLLTNYRHVVSELLFKIREVPINLENIETLGLYVVLVESVIFMRVLSSLDLLRNVTLFISLILAIFCSVHLGLPLFTDQDVAVQYIKLILLLSLDLGFSVYRFLSPHRILPTSFQDICIRNLPLLFRPLLNYSVLDMWIKEALNQFV